MSRSLWTAGVIREVLPNGLTLLVQRDDSAPVAAIVTHVKAGFFDEPDRWTGISHVLEHMFFKGTAGRGVGAIAKETKAAGGYLNASTSYDQTSYFAVLPSSSLAQAIDIQADALMHCAIDPDELARELQVIIQEAKRKRDNPSAVTHETLHEVMFDRHRIRRWRIGHEKELAGLTRDDVWAYYRSRYVPSRTVVAIVCALEEEFALDLARRAYGAWPSAEAARDPSPEEPQRTGVRARTLRGDVSHGEAAFGWRTVPPLHPDSIPLDLAAALLASGRGSWLYRALRERGLATSVHAHNFAPTDLGVFTVSVEADPYRLSAAMELAAEEVSRLTLVGPTELELERARTLVLTRWARSMESMEGRAASLAAAEALDGIGLLDREYAELSLTSGDAVREAAARYLRPEDVSAVAYLPESQGAELTADEVGRAFAVTRLRPLAAATVLIPQRAAASTRGSVQAGVRHVALPGLDILVRRKPGVPLATIGVYLPRLEQDPAEFAGLGALTARSAIRGAGGVDAASLAFAFEGLGGQIGSSSTVDWLGFSCTVLSRNLASAASLLNLVYAEPNYSPPDIEAERSVMVDEATQAVDDMFRYPFQLAFASAFGDSGYGLPTQGLPETLRSIGVEEVRRWHRARLGRGRPAVVAVGDFDPERASDELAGAFSNFPSRPAAERFPVAIWAPGPRPRQRVVERSKTQTAMAMIFPALPRSDPSHSAAEVWGAVASGLGGRLFEALRDRRSLAYTVMASAWQKGRAGALVTYIATSPEREREARDAMLEELERFGREPVSAEELQRAINYLAGQAEVNRQSGASMASEILEAWFIGNGLQEIEDPAGRYRAVSVEEVQQVAEFSLRRDQRVEGIVRGGMKGEE